MRHLKALMLIVLTISVMLLALTSCETVENVVGQIPGIENILPHQHNFVEGKCECGEIDPEYVAPHVHEFVNGKCECGEVDPSFSCLNHVWSEPVLESEATCTKEGRYVITCTVCGYERYTPIFALGHDDDEVTVEATCTEDGLLTKTCKRCGDVREEVIKAEGHEISKSVFEITTAPTCTEKGVVTYPCANCDYFETAELDALGHEFIDGKCVECEAEYVAPAKGGWTLATELKTGDRVLIGNAANGKLLSALKVSAGSFYNKGVDYSADDFANATDDEIWVVTVNDDGSYSFTALNGDKLALAESYSSLNATGVNDKWTLEDKGNGVYYLKNTGRNLYLEWYADKGNWSCYGSVSGNLFDISFYVYVEPSDEEHVHNHISDVHPTTCTEDGYTTYTCECGDTYTVEGDAATGHAYAEKVVAPTCTEAGYTDHTCGNCGDNYKTDEVAAEGHKYSEGTCSVCGGEDPDWHVHEYKDVVTLEPTCTVPGSKVPTCECGDTKEAIEIPVVPHVDTNLDITCDFEGCTKRILPAGDSTVSLFTANHMIIVSLSSNYYVEGVVTEITDAKNGIFIISDGEYSILIRLPKNAEGVAYASWTSGKVTVGDKVKVYGKPAKNSSAPTTEKAKVESGVLTILEHTHSFSEATCTEDSVCECLAVGAPALGHIDENKDNTCDRCPWKMNMAVSDIVVATDPTIANGVTTNGDDGKALYWTWSDDNFDVVIHKGTSTYTVYTTAKAYMQLKKANTLTVNSKNGLVMKAITIRVTNATQLGYLKAAIGTAYTFTEDADAFSITIAYDSAEAFSFANVGSSTVYVSGVEIVYEKPVVEEPALENAVLDLTTKDNRTFYDAADKQVWEQNGIKLTNTKGESTSNVPDKAPFQVNSKGSIIIEGKGIKTIVILVSNTTYGTYFNKILSAVENPNFTYVKSSNTFTITLNEAADIFQLDNITQATAFKTITINPAE